MTFAECLSYIIYDSRIGNHFGFQECWQIYILKRALQISDEREERHFR